MLDKININPKKKILIVYAVLAVVTLAVFWQVNQYDFINLDDNVYVTENSHIQSGITLDGLRWAFSTTYAEFWHPLTWLSLMFDYQLYGMNAGGYHLTNLILHILSTLLLFWLFNRMTGAVWRSAFIATIFSLHPLRVESIAWVAERKDVLSAFFWMLTLCVYVCYTEKPAIKRYFLVLFCFVCGLMSKSMVVTLPVVMILLDYWPLGRFESKKGNWILWQLKEKIPFFIFSAVFTILTIHAQPKTHMPGWPYPLESRIINALVSFVIYLEKIFWPRDLAVCYPFYGQLPLWQALMAGLLILAVSVFVIFSVKRRPYLFAGWLWYSITLLPVIGIIPVGNNAMADRYIYLPSIGITLMLAWGIPSLIKDEAAHKKILFPAAIAALAILSFLTWQQCHYWKNGVELFSHALRITKNNHLAYINRGVNYGKLGQYQRAIEDFNQAIRLQPHYGVAYNNRGNSYAELGQYQLAFEDFNKAIQLQPDYTEAYYNRGNAYAKLGQYQHAIENFNEAIRLNPNYADAYNIRGVAYLLQGNNNSGCRDAQKVCALGNCQLLEFAKGKGYCH
jgi:tetratricopeptide (TPR) repeat protein